jgi:hypothetical protein
MKCFLSLFLLYSGFIYSQQVLLNKCEGIPLLDGTVTPAEYCAVDSAAGFLQMEPFKNQPASENTVVYFTYNDEYIFVGIKCYDSSPDRIVRGIQTRDNLQRSDDAVFIVIDSYNDKRSAFGFGVNAINTQADFRIRDDGRSIDYNWDEKWQSYSTITEYGWSAELALPFRSIAYDRSINDWGLSIRRVIKKNVEVSYWPAAPTYEYQISRNGLMVGLEFPKVTSPFSITPYTTLRYENTRATNEKYELNPEFGVDAHIKITSGLLGNITVNPDFATVEADQERINLTRYELSFPEKRLFFMEGNELYSTRIRTFYSRRIGDIDGGAKVSGKLGDYTTSLIAVRSPGIDALNQPTNYFSIFRLKRDVLKSSSIGFTFADKSNELTYARSFSFDYVLNLGDTWKLTGQFVGSAPGDFYKNMGWFVRFANESNIHHVHVRYTELGTEFRKNVNQTGFVVDDDRREVDSDLTYKWWMKSGIFKYINAVSKNNMFWSHQGTLRSYRFAQEVEFYLQNKFSFEFENIIEYKLFEKNYYNNSFQIEVGYNKEEWASAGLSYEFGRNFDADFEYLKGYFRINPFEKVAVEYSLQKLDFDPDYEFQNTVINILTLNYNFTPDLWIKLFAQNNTSVDRVYFYGLMGWRFIPPFSAVYLIYTFDDYRDSEILQNFNNRILFLKFSYQINF